MTITHSIALKRKKKDEGGEKKTVIIKKENLENSDYFLTLVKMQIYNNTYTTFKNNTWNNQWLNSLPLATHLEKMRKKLSLPPTFFCYIFSLNKHNGL